MRYALIVLSIGFFACCYNILGESQFLFASAVATAGHSRLNLPQETAEVTLNSVAKAELDSVLEHGGVSAGGQLPASVAQTLIESLPARLRIGCKEMISDFGVNPWVSSAWSATLLHAEGGGAERSAPYPFAAQCT